mmetsp:Transcript_8834/g.25462  ORF Transcript_8834/g.25462 Transcript_8834/m.25462 type:complete len:220 (-) Transcript_8834:2132-2791(-)
MGEEEHHDGDVMARHAGAGPEHGGPVGRHVVCELLEPEEQPAPEGQRLCANDGRRNGARLEGLLQLVLGVKVRPEDGLQCLARRAEQCPAAGAVSRATKMPEELLYAKCRGLQHFKVRASAEKPGKHLERFHRELLLTVAQLVCSLCLGDDTLENIHLLQLGGVHGAHHPEALPAAQLDAVAQGGAHLRVTALEEDGDKEVQSLVPGVGGVCLPALPLG